MIQLRTYVPESKLEAFKMFCKRMGVLAIKCNGVSKYGYLNYELHGDGQRVEKVEKEINKWEREIYEASTWYKILKFFKLVK